MGVRVVDLVDDGLRQSEALHVGLDGVNVLHIARSQKHPVRAPEVIRFLLESLPIVGRILGARMGVRRILGEVRAV